MRHDPTLGRAAARTGTGRAFAIVTWLGFVAAAVALALVPGRLLFAWAFA